MTNNPAGAPPVNFLDNPHAPEIYADAVTGIFFFQGNIRLTFESCRVDHATSPGPINRVVLGRVAMPLAAAQGLRSLLNDYLGKIDQEGAEPQAPGPQSVH